jgi:mannose-6-phosphate isomerase-like protein (cupin superfamily)
LERTSSDPEFDEFTYIISGKKQFEIDGEIVVLEKGQSILIEKGARIRTVTRSQILVNILQSAFLHFLWNW